MSKIKNLLFIELFNGKMVKLTAAYVEKKCSQTQSNKSLTKEIDKDHVRKITHLFMNNKFISTIVSF